MSEEQLKQITEEIRSFIMNKRVGFICYLWDKEGEFAGGCQSIDADVGDAMVAVERTLKHFNIDPAILAVALGQDKLEENKTAEVKCVGLLRDILVLYGAIRIINKEDKSWDDPEMVLREARAILEVDREAVDTNDGTRLLRRDEISKAVFEADCALHGATPEQCLANPEILCPDFAVPLDEPYPVEIELDACNKAICKAQRNLTAGIVKATITKEIKSVFHKLPTYKEFKAKYGNRPKDIVYASAQGMILGEILSALRETSGKGDG